MSPKKNPFYCPSPEEIERETSVIHPFDEADHGLEVRAIDEKIVVLRSVRIVSFLEDCQKLLEGSDERIEDARDRLCTIGKRIAARS